MTTNDIQNGSMPESQHEHIITQQEPKKKIPTVRETFVIIILTAGFALGMTVLFFFISTFIPLQSEFLLLEGLFIIPAVLYAKYSRYSIRTFFRLNPVSIRVLITALVTGISVIFIINYLESWLSTMPDVEWFGGWPDDMDARFAETLLFDNLYDFFILTISIVAAAGLCEEMLFRGMIQQSLEEKYFPPNAILITALLFTALHPFSLLPIFLLAIILGIISWRCNSIYPTVIIHALNNGMSLYSLNISESLQQDPSRGIYIPEFLFVLSCIALIISMIILFRQTNTNTERRNNEHRNS